MSNESIDGYRLFQAEGNAFLKVARGGKARPQVFNQEIRFNVISMGIEKLIMSILMEAGQLPDNHTFRDLTAAMEKVHPLEPATVKMLVRMDTYNDICSLANYSRSIPDEAALDHLLQVAESLQDLADALLGPIGKFEVLQEQTN